MKSNLRPAISLFILLSIVTGLAYPLLVDAIAQTFFSYRANGSLITKGGKVVGSELIGQPFSDASYFWSRPSATSPYPYNAAASSGSNLGPTNPALIDAVKSRIDALHAADPQNQSAIPVDLVTASASGLDPHISLAAANYQTSRVAKVRGLSVTEVNVLIARHTEDKLLGVIGEPRVNVLALNLALDEVKH